MALKNLLGSLAVAGLIATAASGCVVRAHGHVGGPVVYTEVEEEPPPPRVVVVDTRPGYIWVEGRWTRNGGRWVWRDGYYERERAGYVWEQGRWERRGRGHVWVEGKWRTGGSTPAVRDHRNNSRPAPPPPQQGPTVRDHRR